MELKVESSVKNFSPEEWDALAGENPVLRHAFFLALEESGSTTPETGWQPCFLSLREGGALRGILPLFAKSHSFGEFVFDWAWADAYEQNGLAYYPKLVSSVPFTPVTGPRLLAASSEHRKILLEGAKQLALRSGASSLHVLFPPEMEAKEIQAQGYMLRQTVQFHWRNLGYEDFAAFLATLRHDKRKKLKQERRKLVEAGISFRRITGLEASEADWDFFFLCYTRTHIQYNSPQAFNRDFFRRLSATMPENLLLVIGERDGKPIAAAFDIFNETHLFGRSWGATEYHPGLHFEACYYQAIEFCLERGIKVFEGGAQGEHKHARGFLPVTTWSAHWLAHPEFSLAVENFLRREENAMRLYVDELGESSPFRRPSN